MKTTLIKFFDMRLVEAIFFSIAFMTWPRHWPFLRINKKKKKKAINTVRRTYTN